MTVLLLSRWRYLPAVSRAVNVASMALHWSLTSLRRNCPNGLLGPLMSYLLTVSRPQAVHPCMSPGVFFGPPDVIAIRLVRLGTWMQIVWHCVWYVDPVNVYSRRDPFDFAVFRNMMPNCRLRQPLVLRLVTMSWLSSCLLIRLTASRLVRGQCRFVCPMRCRTPVLTRLERVPLIVSSMILARSTGVAACLLSCLNVLSRLDVPTLCNPCPALALTTTVCYSFTLVQQLLLCIYLVLLMVLLGTLFAVLRLDLRTGSTREHCGEVTDCSDSEYVPLKCRVEQCPDSCRTVSVGLMFRLLRCLTVNSSLTMVV